MQQLASMMKSSDFPFALEAGKPPSEQAAAALAQAPIDSPDPVDVAAGPANFDAATKLSEARAQVGPDAQAESEPTLKVAENSQKLTENEDNGGLPPNEEPRAEDSPIGLAAAAKILKDTEVYDHAQQSGAMPDWKAAVSGSGDKILSEVTDDVTSYNPFPHKSLAEQMEVRDVWNKARAMAKPAGSLDGDAASARSSIENAEAQADSAAYLAANEAAAVDSYDVSFPNPDTMAVGKRGAMSGQAMANGARLARVHQALARAPRVQALAEVPAAPRAARGSVRRAALRDTRHYEKAYKAEEGAARRAAREEQRALLRALLREALV